MPTMMQWRQFNLPATGNESAASSKERRHLNERSQNELSIVVVVLVLVIIGGQPKPKLGGANEKRLASRFNLLPGARMSAKCVSLIDGRTNCSDFSRSRSFSHSPKNRSRLLSASFGAARVSRSSSANGLLLPLASPLPAVYLFRQGILFANSEETSRAAV